MPLLAVEVRSPSTCGRDAVLKRREYARLDIGSYWLLDVDVPSLRVLELQDGRCVEVAYGEGSTRSRSSGRSPSPSSRAGLFDL